MKKILSISFILLFAILFSAVAEDKSIDCPNCGEQVLYKCYDCNKVHDWKLFRLDEKYPIDEYKYSVCSKCGLIFITETGMPEKMMKAFQSGLFDTLPKNYPSHFYIAKISEALNDHPKIIGDCYLHASFEAETSNPELVNEFLMTALDYYLKALPLVDKTKETLKYSLFAIGELQRRLGDFESAKLTFAQVPIDRFNQNQINYELTLINNKDSDPHGAYDWEKTKKQNEGEGVSQHTSLRVAVKRRSHLAS
jgi:hypothetical protein